MPVFNLIVEHLMCHVTMWTAFTWKVDDLKWKFQTWFVSHLLRISQSHLMILNMWSRCTSNSTFPGQASSCRWCSASYTRGLNERDDLTLFSLRRCWIHVDGVNACIMRREKQSDGHGLKMHHAVLHASFSLHPNGRALSLQYVSKHEYWQTPAEWGHVTWLINIV